jgi:hypothetical protein
MTVGAFASDIGENQLHMALPAIDRDVHGAKGKPGFVVVEVGAGPDRLPARRCVTVFARNRQGAMGASCPAGNGLSRGTGLECEKEYG